MAEEKSGGPAASPEGVVPAEYRLWARELLKLSVDMRRLRPTTEISRGMRGMPMVMRVLLDADGPLSPGQIACAAGVTDARIANTLRALEQWLHQARALRARPTPRRGHRHRGGPQARERALRRALGSGRGLSRGARGA